MRDALAHRGPDDRGIEVNGQVGLVHARLAIVDPSPAGRQPMTGPGGRWVITYNGEVFNHLGLRDRLAGVAFRGHSDTETLVCALTAWGEEAVGLCNGLFAFAALDTAARRLYLVRDRFGVKPLYLARHEGGLWFASEMRALLAAGIPARARGDVLASWVSRGWVPGRTTPLAGVERMLPGTMVVVDLDTLESGERTWYDPARAVDPELSAELAAESRTGLAARLEGALRASVRRRLMSDVPLGTLCSGGLDSSLVTALAASDHPGLVAYNASVEAGGALDEGRWAQRLARHLGVGLETVRVTPSSWREGLVRAVSHSEYPIGEPAPVWLAGIAAAARADGVKVLLTGEGSDELFGGYEHRYRDSLGQFLSAGGRLRRVVHRMHRDRVHVAAAEAVDRLRSPGRRTRPTFPELPEAADFTRAVAERAESAYRHHPGPRGRHEARLIGDLPTRPLPHLLNRMDKNLMQNSVEARLPYLDPDLVRLVLNLPLEARVTPLPKGLLRDVARRWLPRGVAERPKHMGADLNVARLVEERARPEFLAAGRLREALEVPEQPWRQLVATARREPRLRLWTTEIWCRVVAGRQPVEEVHSALWG